MADEPILRIEELTKTFQTEFGKISLFGGLSAELEEGDFAAITGPTGVGKTTLINIVAGLETASAGRVTVLGEDVASMNDAKRTEFRGRNVGMVFQESRLLANANVFENIELPLIIQAVKESERIRRTGEVLEFFGLARKAYDYPTSLSTGENRKVAIARALVTEPSLLLMDEPTGGLDAATVNILAPVLRGIHYFHRGTILMATNNLSLARIASREIPIDRPRIVMACQS